MTLPLNADVVTVAMLLEDKLRTVNCFSPRKVWSISASIWLLAKFSSDTTGSKPKLCLSSSLISLLWKSLTYLLKILRVVNFLTSCYPSQHNLRYAGMQNVWSQNAVRRKVEISQLIQSQEGLGHLRNQMWVVTQGNWVFKI